MRVLVTGGAGYVGSSLVPLLLAQGHHVRVIDNMPAGGDGLLLCCANPRFEIVRRDVSDEEALASALDDIDVVVHLAGVVGHQACQREPAHAWTTNVDGTRRLLEFRRTDQRVLFASTGSVYGKVRDKVCTESTDVSPLTLYARSKAVGEQLVLEAGNCVVFRYATGFGVSQRMRLDLLVNDFVYQAVAHGNLIVYQADSQRTLIHVSDMARSIAFVLQRWDDLVDDVYNVGNEKLNLSKREIADKVHNRVNCYLHFAEFASDPDERDYVVSYDKIRAKGFTAEVDLEAGLSELISAIKLLA